MPQFCAKNLLANSKNKHHQASAGKKRSREGERWRKKESKRKKGRKHKQTKKRKNFCIFLPHSMRCYHRLGLCCYPHPYLTSFPFFPHFLLLNLFVSLCVCIYVCFMLIFMSTTSFSQNVPLKLAPAYDAARACVSVYRMHTVNIISEFWVATLFPIRQTSKLNSFFCSLRCDVMLPCNANAFTWKQFWYANIKMIWINWIVISIFDFKRMSSYLNENVHEMCVILIDVSVSKCLYGRKKK